MPAPKWYIKYRNSNKEVVTVGYVDPDSLEEAGYTVVEGKGDLPQEDYFEHNKNTGKTCKKKYNKTKKKIQDK